MKDPKTNQNEIHEHIKGRGLISNIALGLSDGLVTNLSFLAGFSGAVSSIGIIRLAGVAAMLAGAVSMCFGGILAARSEAQLFEADARREAGEIEEEPEEERQELRSFYLEKGLTKQETDIVVNRITSNKKKWLDDMLAHELHIHREKLESPYKLGAAIGLAFLVGAFVPLAPYLLSLNILSGIIASVILSLSFLFLAGAWKGRIMGRNMMRSSVEMLLIGVAASLFLFVIGKILVFA